MRTRPTHQHTLYLDDKVIARLRSAAKYHKRTQSEIVEEALKFWFDAADTLLAVRT